MSTPFQNRLVGTIIIAAVVIIFLPDILDGEKQSYQAEFEQIPTAPAFVPKQTGQTFPTEKLENIPQEQISDEQAIDIENIDLPALDNENEAVKVAVLAKEKTIGSTSEPTALPDQTTQKIEVALSKVTNNLPEKAEINTAWVIHLGSFRNKQNVKSLLNKLKNNGYTAFTRPIQTKNGVLTKVFIGPELIKSSLDKKLPKLKDLTEIQGKVALYEANK